MNVLRSSILLSGIILYYFPSIVYIDNAKFFDTSFPSISLVLFPLLVAATVLFWLPSLILKPEWKEKYAVLLSSIAFVGWFFGLFLVSDMGLLDGHKEPKSVSDLYRWLELAAAVAGLVLLIAAGWKWPKPHRNAALFLILLTAGLTTVALFTNKQNRSSKKPPETLLRASSQKNIFVILFDSFQSDIFEEIIKENPAVFAKLDGFTFFRQTITAAHSTYLSMPTIHSGSIYSNQPIQDYLKEGIQKKSFLVTLASKGYEASLINSVWPCPTGVTCGRFAHVVDDFWSPIIREVALLLDVSLYRFVPSFFRPQLYNRGEGTVQKLKIIAGWKSLAQFDIEFFQLLKSRLSPSTDRPVVRFLHSYITHVPVDVNAECGSVGNEPWNWGTAKGESRCAVKLFTKFLDDLKEKGLYDKSLIVLMSDHGAGLSNNLEPPTLARARALLVIKPFESHGTLKISNRLLQVGDIPTTICKLAGDCENETGRFAFGEEPEKRTFLYLEHKWDKKFWKAKNVPIDAVWEISGPVDNILSWYKQTTIPEMKNVHLDFSTHDPGASFGMGWRRVTRGQTYRRARDSHAQLYLPLKLKKNVRVNIHISPPANTDQSIKLYLDDLYIGERPVFPRWQTLSFDLPGESIVRPVTRLTFEFKIEDRSKAVDVAFDTLDVMYE